MTDWNEYQKQIQHQLAAIGRTNREVIKGYRELSNAGAATNLLGEKTRELIALAVAVTRQCDGCIVTHTDGATTMLNLNHTFTVSQIDWFRKGSALNTMVH